MTIERAAAWVIVGGILAACSTTLILAAIAIIYTANQTIAFFL